MHRTDDEPIPARGDNGKDSARSGSQTRNSDAERSLAGSNSRRRRQPILKANVILKELEAITQQSLERLYNFQHSDGGWGWWKEGESDHFMTAYVLWGMTLARQAGIEMKLDVVERAADYLDKELVEEEVNYDAQAWMLHALAVLSRCRQAERKATEFQVPDQAFENLWTNRDKLNAYTRALLALAAHNFGYADTARRRWFENLENGVKLDSKPDTSIVQQWRSGIGSFGDRLPHTGARMEFTGAGLTAVSKQRRLRLRALLAIDPKNKLVEPVTNWLIKNRRGAQWSNTRDTAIVVLTLNDYLRTAVSSAVARISIVGEWTVRSRRSKSLPTTLSARRVNSRFPAS